MKAAQKGFTLIEMVVAVIIMGVCVVIALPNLTNSFEKSRAQVAQNDLLSITAAQSKFNEDYGPNVYCISTVGPTGTATAIPPFCGDNAADLNSYLHLSLSSSFTYVCTNGAAPYLCTATDGTLTLTTTGTTVACAPAGNVNCPY